MTLSITLIALGAIGLFVFGIRGLRTARRRTAAPVGTTSGIEVADDLPSECGSDLDRDLAVRRGSLRRKPVLALVFSSVLVLGVTLTGYRVFLTATNMPMAQRPVWLLTFDVRQGHPGAGRPCRLE